MRGQSRITTKEVALSEFTEVPPPALWTPRMKKPVPPYLGFRWHNNAIKMASFGYLERVEY